MHIVEHSRRVECDVCQDRHLATGVQPFHVRRWVRFRIAEGRRFCEGVLVAHAMLRHICQDVVRRAVHDANDLRKMVGSEVFLQRLHDRDRPKRRRFVAEIALHLSSQRLQLAPMHSDQILVGADNVLAGAQRFCEIGARWFDAAHQLDDDGDLVVVQNILPFRRQGRMRHHLVGVFCRRAHQYTLDLHICANLVLKIVLLQLFDHFIHTGTNSPHAQKRYLNRFFSHASPPSLVNSDRSAQP